MDFVEDIFNNKPRIEQCIQAHGYAPEHNFWWYAAQQDKNAKLVFAGGRDHTGLLTIEEEKRGKATIFSSPLAPLAERTLLMLEYLEHIFYASSNIKRLSLN